MEEANRNHFLAVARPMVQWVARHRAVAGHAVLSREDIYQEGLVALLVVWERYHWEKTLHDLVRIARRAILNRLASIARHERLTVRGDPELFHPDAVVTRVNLDEHLDADDSEGLTWSDLLGGNGIEDCYFWFALEELEASLDSVACAVLGELLDPGEATLHAVRCLWKRTRGAGGQQLWLRQRPQILARGLGFKVSVVHLALRQVQAQAKRIFLPGPSPLWRSRELEQQQPKQPKGDLTMGKKGFVPEGLEGLDVGAVAVEQVPVVAEVKTARAKSGKGKAVKKAKVAAKKADGKVAKAKPSAEKVTNGFRAGSQSEKVFLHLKKVQEKRGMFGIGDAAEAFKRLGKEEALARNTGAWFIAALLRRGYCKRKDVGVYALTQ